MRDLESNLRPDSGMTALTEFDWSRAIVPQISERSEANGVGASAAEFRPLVTAHE